MTPHNVHAKINEVYAGESDSLTSISSGLVHDATSFISYDAVVRKIFGNTQPPCSPDMYDFLGNNFVFTEFKNIQGAWGDDAKMAPIIKQTKDKIYEGVGWAFFNIIKSMFDHCDVKKFNSYGKEFVLVVSITPSHSNQNVAKAKSVIRTSLARANKTETNDVKEKFNLGSITEFHFKRFELVFATSYSNSTFRADQRIASR